MIDETFEWRKITLKHTGKCIICGHYISEGYEVLWMQNLGIKHIECPVDLEPVKDNSALVVIDEDDKEMLGIK